MKKTQNSIRQKMDKKLNNLNKSFVQRIITVLLVFVIVTNFAFIIASQKAKYTTFTFWQSYPQLKQIYLDSQYVNKHPKGWIPDEAVNAYAGAAYVKGVSPILIASDTPPLGIYFIGFSALLFS